MRLLLAYGLPGLDQPFQRREPLTTLVKVGGRQVDVDPACLRKVPRTEGLAERNELRLDARFDVVRVELEEKNAKPPRIVIDLTLLRGVALVGLGAHAKGGLQAINDWLQVRANLCDVHVVYAYIRGDVRGCGGGRRGGP